MKPKDVVKVDKIIVRNAGLVVYYRDVNKVRAQVAAVFNTKADNILFTFEELPADTAVTQTVDINNKNSF